MNPTKIRTRVADQAASATNPIWEKADKAVLLPLLRNRDRQVPLQPTKANKAKPVRAISVPRMTIKGNPMGLMTSVTPEIIRPNSGRTMF